MTLLTDVVDRLSDQVGALKSRVEQVAELAALVADGALPQRDVACFVVPLGFDDRGVGTVTGLYTQSISEAIGVILLVKSVGDAKARSALPKVDALKDAVIESLAGWAPDDFVGVLTVTRGRLVSVQNGLVIYQLDFSILDQLRITR